MGSVSNIFYDLPAHTHLLFWRSWIDPVMKHLGVFTFRRTSARRQAPGQARTRPWVGLQRFIFSHCHIPIFPAAMTGVWSVSGTWYIWDIYTTGAFASIRTYTYISNQAQTHFSSFIFITHNGVSGSYLLLARGQVVPIFCRTTFAACRGLGWAHWFLVVAWLVQAEVPRDKPGHCK